MLKTSINKLTVYESASPQKRNYRTWIYHCCATICATKFIDVVKLKILIIFQLDMFNKQIFKKNHILIGLGCFISS